MLALHHAKRSQLRERDSSIVNPSHRQPQTILVGLVTENNDVLVVLCIICKCMKTNPKLQIVDENNRGITEKCKLAFKDILFQEFPLLSLNSLGQNTF